MSERGKKRSSWQREMMAKYRDVRVCEWYEGCSQEATDNAHRLKKNKITTRLEYVDGRAKLCRFHHLFAEEGDRQHPSSHERMWSLVNRCMEQQGRFIPAQVMLDEIGPAALTGLEDFFYEST